MNKRMFLLLSMLLLLPWPSEACTLTWNANPETNLWGYRIYNALAPNDPGPYSAQVGLVTTMDCGPETDGLTHYFRLTSLNSSGQESAKSVEVSKLFASVVTPPPPPPPVPSGGAQAFVTQVVPDATGTTLTILGPASAMMYQNDLVKVWTLLPGFVPLSATWHDTFSWIGLTFTCYQAVGTDGVQTAGGCTPPPAVIVPPPVPVALDKLVVTSDTLTVVTVEYDTKNCPSGVTKTTSGTTTHKKITLTCK